jgi:DNA polymerase-3 subunit delta'
VKLAEIIGHRDPIGLLQRAVRGGRLPHALLLQGPEGVGKGTVARALGAALLCEADGDEACGRCDACLKVERRAHPDLLFVRRLPKKLTKPEEERPPMQDVTDEELADQDLSNFIRVFQIRALLRHAAHAPREGRRRVFVIDPADCMNEESQNALLKTLEEPPGQAVLMLVASRPHLLLPTVRSRSFSVRFGPLAASELARALEQRGLPSDEAATRATLAGGRPGLALRLDPAGLAQRRDEILDDLEALAGGAAGPLAELPDMAAALAGRSDDTFLQGLGLLQDLLRESTRLASGVGGESAPDPRLEGRLEQLGRRLGPERSAALVHGIDRVRRDLRFNLNRTLAAESLLAAVAGGPLP